MGLETILIGLNEKNKVDAIVCYESDQIICSTSWTCEQLGLLG